MKCNSSKPKKCKNLNSNRYNKANRPNSNNNLHINKPNFEYYHIYLCYAVTFKFNFYILFQSIIYNLTVQT